MSACLIITQGNNMFIGADSACSVKNNTGFKRCFDDAQKLFCIGEQVFFCSGNMNNAYKCVDWIKNQFTHFICVEKLKKYLIENYSDIQDEYYSIEILIADYSNSTVYQLSQYNNFNIITYPYSEHIRVICGGYKTSENFQLAKENILMKKPIHDIYFDTYNSIVNECLGGYLYLYSSPNSFSKIRLLEKNIKYANANNYHLLTSEFVTSGHIYGSQLIGGEIISENYSSTTGTYINLKDGTFSFGGGKITYNGNSLILNGVDLMWADIVDAPKKVSEFENDSGYQNAIQVTKITKDTVTAPFIKTLNLTVGNEIIMGSNATISWNNVTNQPTIPSRTSQLTNDSGYQNSSQVTTITKNTITTSYVNALNITAGSVAAENITGTYISGKTISGGKIIGTEISNGNGTFYVDKNGSVTASDINITGGTIGEFKLYYSRTSGSYYLETIPTTSTPLTTGIGNNNNWAFWTGYSYSTDTATFWVTNNGEVHMRNWLYGITKNSWAIWTTTDRSNRYGLEYIFGDWDSNQSIMNIKFVFHDYSNGQKFHYNLPLTGTISGMP